MDGVLIDLGFIQIYWYSIFIFVALLVGGSLALKQASKKGISEDEMINYFFFLIPICILGARLYYVIFNFNLYKDNLLDILKIWEGGLAIHGGLLAGIIFTLIYCKKNSYSFLELADILSVSLIIGQAIGRWGNFFNKEAHGPEISREILEKFIPFDFIIEGMNIGGVYYHPTFLYESLWCLLGFIILVIIRNKLYRGQTFSLYLMIYSIARFFIESLRTDSLMLFNIKVAQLVSIILFIIGLIIFIKKQREYKKLLANT